MNLTIIDVIVIIVCLVVSAISALLGKYDTATYYLLLGIFSVVVQGKCNHVVIHLEEDLEDDDTNEDDKCED